MRIPTLVAITLMAFATSGCSMFSGPPLLASAQSEEIEMSGYFEQRLATGKRELTEGRISRAITAFRQASYHPDLAADAKNGMAVSYARLGRDDLAERFFREAIALAPEDERFQRNLARLMPVAVPQEAPRRRASGELPPVAAAPQDKTSDPALTRAAEVRAPDTVQPATRGPAWAASDTAIIPRGAQARPEEVFITTQNAVARAAALIPYARGERFAQVGERPGYPVRIEF